MLSLNDYIGNGQPAVLVVIDPEDKSITLGDAAGKGFYLDWQYDVINQYSNTDSLGTMTSDQLSKLKKNKTSPDDTTFLLSWTLTQQPADMAEDTTIIDLANQANDALWLNVFPASNANSIPNIIYCDNFASSSITSLSIAINHAFATQTANKQRRAMHKKRHSSPVF